MANLMLVSRNVRPDDRHLTGQKVANNSVDSTKDEVAGPILVAHADGGKAGLVELNLPLADRMLPGNALMEIELFLPYENGSTVPLGAMQEGDVVRLSFYSPRLAEEGRIADSAVVMMVSAREEFETHRYPIQVIRTEPSLHVWNEKSDDDPSNDRLPLRCDRESRLPMDGGVQRSTSETSITAPAINRLSSAEHSPRALLDAVGTALLMAGIVAAMLFRVI